LIVLIKESLPLHLTNEKQAQQQEGKVEILYLSHSLAHYFLCAPKTFSACFIGK